MTARTTVHRLQVANELFTFVNEQVLPGTGVSADQFWSGFDALVADLAPKNIALLAERDRLQTELDTWHRANPGPIRDMAGYRKFLETIGYLVPQPAGAKATTTNVDAELATQAGPQLVVPILNARYALNAANARWGSLYDALYGTDAIPEADGCEKGPGYNDKRGAKVIAFARQFLDDAAPLAEGSHADATVYHVVDGRLLVSLTGGRRVALKDPAQFIGYQGEAAGPSSVLLQHNGLHLDIIINRATAIGQTDKAGVADVVLEAALSTILDLEDSVAAVDAADKVLGYSNWLGILKGTLTEDVAKGGKTFKRGLNPDRLYTAPNGSGQVRLHGRSLMFVRNVGHLMTNPAILWDRRPGRGARDPRGHHGRDGHHHHRPARPAGPRQGRHPQQPHRQRLHRQAQDARPGRGGFCRRAVLARGTGAGPGRQHRQAGHHGRRAPHQRQPQGLHRRRRQPCRLHQHRLPGPHRRRNAHRHAGRPDDPQGRHEDQRLDHRLRASNVLVGLSCGLRGKAQIGKGMWAMPDLMAAMLEQKIAHPKAGANTAWVPSPTGATLHACTTTRSRWPTSRPNWKKPTPTPPVTNCWLAC
jgi:malate synthase